MRIAVVVLARCLLFLFVIDARAQGAGASAATVDSRGDDVPALRPAIREVAIENLGDDGVIVVFSRRSERKPFHHASRLPPGGKAVVPVPDLPSLRASILRRNEVRRAARKDGQPRNHDRDAGKDASQRNLLLLGAIVGANRNNDNRNNRAEPSRDDRYGQQGGNPSQHGNHDDPRFDDYGQQGSGRTERETANLNDGTYHVLLGNMLGNAVGDSKGNGPNLPAGNDDPPGEIDLIDADEGPGERIVNGVAITVATGDAEGVEEDPGIAGGGGSIAISNDLVPVNAAAPAEPAPTCYCGPDITAAYLQALQRVHDRIRDLPDSEHGAWDGAWFLSRNAGSLDERARPVQKPGAKPADEDLAAPSDSWLCPSGPCAKLEPIGGTTMSLFGVCLPQHVGNDVMYGYVGTRLGVPREIQILGGHYAQVSSYGGMDPVESHVAYDIGGAIARMQVQRFDEGSVGKVFREATFMQMRGATQPPLFLNALGALQQSYPALAACPRCPEDAIRPGTLLRDWTTSSWTLDDGTRVHPPGGPIGED